MPSEINTYKWQFKTPLGTMIGISSSTHLLLLEFEDRINFQQSIDKIRTEYSGQQIEQSTSIFQQVDRELNAYFDGGLQQFSIPIAYTGTSFQKNVWSQVSRISYGSSHSYHDIAYSLKNKAYQAVGAAVGANHIAIIVPCHRVVSKNNSLGGYAGGLARKQWLLKHENGKCFMPHTKY